MIKKSLKTLFLLSSIAFLSCSRTNEKIPQDIMIKDFIWGGMNAYYKWQEDVPDLADDKFITQDQLNSYLGEFGSAEDLFEKLKSQGDTYSSSVNTIVENYNILEEEFRDPIVISKKITKGGKEIGYLLYNRFTSSFDEDLNTVFQNFKNDNITELIVDLRNNKGGSTRSAQYLASMITGQFTGEVFCIEEWNNKVMKNVNTDFKKKFVEEINHDGINVSINSLELDKVYFIVSEETASASEVLINGLKSYIDVVLIGSKTKGEPFGFVTLYDSDDYTKNGENFNDSHTYALQLIVSELKNSDGENKLEGFEPDFQASGSGVLGDELEALLSKTLSVIN